MAIAAQATVPPDSVEPLTSARVNQVASTHVLDLDPLCWEAVPILTHAGCHRVLGDGKVLMRRQTFRLSLHSLRSLFASGRNMKRR